MKIAMFTNTYLPQVGGVANSVAQFTAGLRQRGHQVVVVAPSYEDQPDDEQDVVRLPALQHFNGSDFSLALPIPSGLTGWIDDFAPDLIHAHHPFLVGVIALRLAASRGLPLVFTHHTMYEHYTHYFPVGADSLHGFAIRLATEYANLCQRVIAPSESVRDIIAERGVSVPIAVLPTGVDRDRFANGDGLRMRQREGIPDGAFVIGHVGRLAAEKNLGYLGQAVAKAAAADPKVHVLIVGEGPAYAEIEEAFTTADCRDQLHLTGNQDSQDLVDAYHAMDLFAFASHSETQGMVLAEVLSVGCPVVALDAPGVREVITDGENGRLLPAAASPEDFAYALREVRGWIEADRARMRTVAFASSAPFSTTNCLDALLEIYAAVLDQQPQAIDLEQTQLAHLFRSLECEWDLWSGRLGAAVDSVIAANDANDATADGG